MNCLLVLKLGNSLFLLIFWCGFFVVIWDLGWGVGFCCGCLLFILRFLLINVVVVLLFEIFCWRVKFFFILKLLFNKFFCCWRFCNLVVFRCVSFFWILENCVGVNFGLDVVMVKFVGVFIVDSIKLLDMFLILILFWLRFFSLLNRVVWNEWFGVGCRNIEEWVIGFVLMVK